MTERPMVTMVCTGNAARSVMAALLLRDRLGDDGPVEVASAGTLVLPGHPMSTRTAPRLSGMVSPTPITGPGSSNSPTCTAARCSSSWSRPTSTGCNGVSRRRCRSRVR